VVAEEQAVQVGGQVGSEPGLDVQRVTDLVEW
jgi:hypothetical protein